MHRGWQNNLDQARCGAVGVGAAKAIGRGGRCLNAQFIQDVHHRFPVVLHTLRWTGCSALRQTDEHERAAAFLLLRTVVVAFVVAQVLDHGLARVDDGRERGEHLLDADGHFVRVDEVCGANRHFFQSVEQRVHWRARALG